MSERINVYVCEYGCHTVTIDVDEGVTPMFIKCRAAPRPDRPIEKRFLDENGECNGRATSSMYPPPPMPSWIGKPTHEWYRPTELSDLDPETREHVERGGLLLRKREVQP